MQVWLAALVGALITAVGSMVGRALISLGIGFVAYQGISFGLTSLKAQAFAYIGAMPPAIVGMLGVMKVGTAINIVCAALVARATIAGLTSGVVRRLVFGVGDVRRAGG